MQSPSPGGQEPQPPGSGTSKPLPTTGTPYDAGSPEGMTHLWVDAAGGSDDASGASRSQALRTLTAAWERIPARTTLSTGFHVHITPGVLPEGGVPGYWEHRWGTFAAPITIEAADGQGTVTLPVLNVFDCRYLYFIDVRIVGGGGNVFHCELCQNLLMRRVTVEGTPAVSETVKLNQCQGIYIESCDFSGAWGAGDNALDCVACQYGHILSSRFHDANWCIYLKGGSAYFLISGNEVYNCRESGLAAGQGTGFEFMERPWITHETYDFKMVNNVIHEVWGAGIGVYGSYDTLVAHNTLYRVGDRSHALEVKLGDRSCDGDSQKVSNCNTYLDAGGWGPRTPSSSAGKVPSRNVIIANNLLLNPDGFRSPDQHFQIDAPELSHISTLPQYVSADTNLVIRGNLLWNGPADLELGFGPGACGDDNPTCNAALVRAQNKINSIKPQLDAGYRPVAASLAAFSQLWTPLPAFGPWDVGLGVPAGTLENAVPLDKDGQARSAANNAPGAFVLP